MSLQDRAKPTMRCSGAEATPLGLYVGSLQLQLEMIKENQIPIKPAGRQAHSFKGEIL